MHSLLQRQIRRFFGDGVVPSHELDSFIQAINDTYHQADTDRIMTERSLDLTSQEMLEQNRALAAELEVRRATESQLEYLTNYDALTGLVSRRLFSDRLKHALTGANRRTQVVAVLVLGLDFFKTINDSLGYEIGNEILRITAERLANAVRASDTVARLGADEFALVLIEPNVESLPTKQAQSKLDEIDSSYPQITDILQRILISVSKTFLLAEQELQMTCSIGVSLYPHDGSDAEILLKNASAAMSSAKQLGHNNFQFYTSDLSARIHQRLNIQSKLRLALEREEFVLHYQPQVDLRTGHIVGMEALIRWNQPGIGITSPGHFIGAAEETGLIVPIGAWVIRTACVQCKAWQENGYGNFRIAVNLSVRQFSQPDLLEFIATVLKETGLDPERLEIELTESLVMTNVERSIEILQGLKALGVQLSIDDFGTGYSSLSYLKRFPVDVLKIDQSFVRDINKEDDAAIVKAIISLSHSLGIQVIAEGVEAETQCDFLRTHLCDEIQGFFFSKGLPKDEIEVLLKKKQRLPDHLLHFSKHVRTLLLVDDELNVLSTLKRTLRAENCIILTASSGQAGLDLLAQYQVDVIVSDQRMPGMTGVDFFCIAKEKYPDTVRIILSGYTELQAVIDSVNKGAIYQFLTKPWDNFQLKLHIEEAFKHKEMADENRRLSMDVQTQSLTIAKQNRQSRNHKTENRQDLLEMQKHGC
ncbi:EAL domain-containing protein [Undibacterium sp. Di26W]|uniref:EAL domain-containing protein n=1 Tax=Undibacterium sp. Di26W TaxID=3413035 RepID=UPI003BF24607